MKKNQFIAMAICSLLLLMVSCKDKNTVKNGIEKEEVSSNKKPDDRKDAPPHGDKKRSPKAGGPEQTKTLAEIGGYTHGEIATDFSLKNIDGKMISLESFDNAKGYIVTFTCNECPFAKLYEDRLIQLHKSYAPKGYPVIAINSNNPEVNGESYQDMQNRANKKAFPFVYVMDNNQNLYAQYGAVRTPHVFLLDKNRKVQYIGAIDDNARSAEDVKHKYLENAIEALEKGETINPNLTKAIGCPIKPRKV